MNFFNWKGAKDDEFSKLLRIPFRLNLKVKDVKMFLVDKIKNKLRFWNSVHLFWVIRVVVVSLVLASFL
jgi:hypothetical protein